MRFSLAVLIVTAAPAFSQELPSGTYALQIDGGVGRAAVIGRLAKISIGGSGCAGGVTGVLASEAPDAWEINLDTDAGLCTVAVVRQASGYPVEEANCGYFHGAACSFSGSMTQTGGNSYASAMREASEAFEPGERSQNSGLAISDRGRLQLQAPRRIAEPRDLLAPASADLHRGLAPPPQCHPPALCPATDAARSRGPAPHTPSPAPDDAPPPCFDKPPSTPEPRSRDGQEVVLDTIHSHEHLVQVPAPAPA